jgi:putative ABC transport system permease protein
MIQNYLKIALRNLLRNKVYSFINIAGLAVGMAVAMLIGLWMYDEFSANKHHKNYDTIYQIMMHQTFDGHRGSQTSMPYPTGEELKTKYPDFQRVAMCDWGMEHALLIGNKKMMKMGHFFGEEGMEMFGFNILKGDKNPLHDPYSIVLTDETARAIFGDENPLGKVLKMDNSFDLKVTAIIEKQPKNASITFDFLVPFHLQESVYDYIKKYHKTNWGNNSWQIFVQLRPDADPVKVNGKIKELVRSHLKDNPMMVNTVKPEVFLHPMSKWKLYANFEEGVNTGGFIKYVRLFGILGFLVLVIACINFMNLSTARSEKRAKEVGIRKAVGSVRGQLIGQFLSESLLISFVAFILALGIVSLALPFFNTMTEKEMSLQLSNPFFWAIMIAFTLLTGLLAGSYPAFYLSAFNPVRVLKGNLHVGKSGSLPRKILVVTQFACSVILMIGTIIIYQQIQHGKNRPIGFDSKGLISIDYSNDIAKNFDALTNDLVSSGAVTSICKSNSPPTNIYSNNAGWEWTGSKPDDKSAIFSTIVTNYNYAKTMGIKLIAGRDFSKDYATDSSGVLLNQAAVKRMNLKEPIVNQMISWNGKPMKVIGIIPDMQMQSPFRPVSPLTVVYGDWGGYLSIRLNPAKSASESIKKIQPIFDRYNPGFPFDYKFADEQYAKKFNYEELVGKLAAVVAILAIFISCLGLFGLASFMAEQRTKEIGVRKVLGASVMNLWQLLSKDFVMLVLIACGIAIPIAYYAMNEWLKDYEYKINIGVGVFALVVVLAIVITLLTVSYQAIRAALANPVKSLRTE